MSVLTYEAVRCIVTDYLKYRNYSAYTIAGIASSLKKFGRYLGLKDISDYRDAVPADYYGFMDYASKSSRKGEGLSRNSINLLCGHIKRVFAILAEEEKILVNPFSGIEIRKTPRTIRDKILSEAEMAEILDAMDGDSVLEVRDRAILETLYGTGIRSGELLNLETGDFMSEDKMIFIRNGKGKKDRILPAGTACHESLCRYLKNARPKLSNRRNKTSRIFLGWNGRALAMSGLRRVVRNAMRGITSRGKKLGTHSIRHSFATHLISAGADVREVQLLLGHASIKATQAYLNLTGERYKEIYRKYHPLENELYFDPYTKESYIAKWNSMILNNSASKLEKETSGSYDK